MEVIEGDGTPRSYMEASLFARVTAEFGVFWEGHLAEQDVILGADPFSTGEDVTDARTKLPSIRHLVDRVMFTGMLSHYARRELVSLTLAYTQANLDGMCESFFKVSLIDEESDTSGFRQGLQRYADEWYEARGNRQRLRKNFTLVMLDMLRLSRRTGVWPERDVIKYIRSSIAIDGLITRFAPGFDVGAYLESTCARHLKQARQSYITSEALVDWSLESGHLIRDGLPRVVELLGRLSNSTMVSERVNHGNPKRQQALHMGIVVFAVSLLMTVTEEPILFGFNLFTVEILLLAVLSVMLVWIITTQH